MTKKVYVFVNSPNNRQLLLNEVDQNIVICQWQTNSLFAKANINIVINLQDSDKS